ncbi:AAA family ATPase [Lysobacter sp. A3-1-A15]|uniref:AAA family ATPase n=1 Tax=Novilysobacter viscosus TaxID=3098602 RepID=UPI002EDAAA1D
MRLKTVKLINFRGYREVVLPFEEAMTGIVGRNDYGKSTILEALDIFFDGGTVKVDKSDMNCFALASGEDRFEISCEFDDLPASLVLDTNVETTLAQEHLLNASRAFEVVKTFKASTGKLERTAIRCEHPASSPLDSLLSLKITDLKKLGREMGVTDAVADERVASLWRQAIWQSASTFQCQETLLDVDKGLSTDAKSIWSKVEEHLPTYALFKSDRESSDGDAEAKNPLQQAVKEAQAALQEQIGALERQVESSVLDVANRTLEKLKEMAPELANELRPRFKEKPKWSFSFTLDGENGIPINKRGSGVRRLILLNFFRAEAEKVAGIARNVIYAIEEPETSQHPNYQIMLMKALLALAGQPNRQIIITTHVPALAGLIPANGVRYVAKDEAGVPLIKMPDEAVLKEAAESLGVLPESGMERAQAVVLVEGKTDVLFLRHTSAALKNAGRVSFSLEEAKVVAIPIGGSGSVKHWVTLKLADSLGLPWCVFGDSDVGGDISAVKSTQRRKAEVEATGRKFHITRKREIENYLCPALITRLTGQEVNYSDTCDAKKIIAAATGTANDDVIDRFWPEMTADLILERSAYVVDEEERYELQELVDDLLALVRR